MWRRWCLWSSGLRARAEVETIRPGCLWLSESVEPGFLTGLRSKGLRAHSDSEIYQAFDLCYDYDIFPTFLEYLNGTVPLERYAEAVNRQEYIYPENYVKLRFLENHDNNRVCQLIPDPLALDNHTAFLFFQKGMTLLYAGQEVDAVHTPSLFDRDPIHWDTGHDRSPLLRRLAGLKQHPLLADGAYHVQALPRDILLVTYEKAGKRLIGIFSLRGQQSLLPVDLPDGQYRNLLDGTPVELRAGRLGCNGRPIVFEA